jgi:hypothetical protein
MSQASEADEDVCNGNIYGPHVLAEPTPDKEAQ